MTWNDTYLALFDRTVIRYRAGERNLAKLYSAADLEFLASIGCQTREFFDFVEDFCEEQCPTISSSLLVAAVRRDYFITVQKGQKSAQILTRDAIPTFGEELAGMAYLPRILAKGRAKLRGELDPDLMFGCGGDRKFLANHGQIPLADFLRRVWACGEDTEKLTDWIKQQMA
jgi:Domain of unknown function (DUF5069)